MRLFLRVVYSVFFFAVITSFGLSQSLEESGVIKSQRFLVLTIVGNGEYELRFANTFTFREPATLAELVTGELIASEIGLNEQQTKACKKISSDSRAFIGTARERIISASDATRREEFASWFTLESEKIESELKKVLGESRFERAEQIERQIDLRRNGVLYEVERLLKENNIRLSEADLKRLDSVKTKYREKLNLDSAEYLGLLIENEFAEIKDLMKGSKNEMFRVCFPLDNPPYCLDLMSISAQDTEREQLSKVGETFDEFFRHPRLYKVNNSGNWKAFGFESSTRAGNFEIADGLASFLDNLENGALGDSLELGESQLLLVSNLRQKVIQGFGEMELYLANSKNIWLDYENVIDMQIGLSMLVERELSSVLTSQQDRALRNGLSKLSVAKNGMLLSDFDLKNQFEITQSQVNVLRKTILDVSKKINKTSEGFFVEYALAVISAIEDKEAHDVLTSYFGKLVNVGGASLSVIQFDLINNGK